MQLLFIVVIEPLDFAQLWRTARTQWTLVIAVGVVVLSIGRIAAFRMAVQKHEEVAIATLRVGSVPVGATVEVEGQAYGSTPLTTTIVSGEHRANLSCDGHDESNYVIRAGPDETMAVDPDLWLRSPLLARRRPTYPGASMEKARFGRDGRVALAVVLPPGGERQLRLVEGPGRVHRVGPSAVYGRLAIIPDGGRVAYRAKGEGSLPSDERLKKEWASSRDCERGEGRYVLRAAQRDERLLDLNRAPVGRHLLIASHRRAPSSASRARLLLWNAASSDLRELVSVPAEVVASNCDWSPDGTWVSFLTRAGRINSLCLAGTDGEFRYLADLGQEDSLPLPISRLAWSTDGRQVLCAALMQNRPTAGEWFAVANLETSQREHVLVRFQSEAAR